MYLLWLQLFKYQAVGWLAWGAAFRAFVFALAIPFLAPDTAAMAFVLVQP